ncbi:MAG: hypothetical protein KAI47_24420, partial [Deltaproteobacteria bacterium]|nr:hypothetical protein [Deltaproteobacteria bacterium]
KKRKGPEPGKMLEKLLERLDRMSAWSAEHLEASFRDFSETESWSTRELFMTVRIAVTGRKASPSLFDTMVVIGREICRRRLRQAAIFLKQRKG